MSVWRRGPVILIALAIASLALTFNRPSVLLGRPVYRYVFVFDISQSMNVTDIPGREMQISRLNFAKQNIIDSLTKLPCGAETGLALFTGHRAFLLLKPVEVCANYSELSAMLNNVSWRMTWEARSEIAKGVFKSIKLLQHLDDNPSLVFVTDGHEAPPINPELPPRFPGEKGDITGLIVGVGGDDPVPIPKFDAEGVQRGYWKADEVSHIDDFRRSQQAREGTDSAITGTEHLSSVRESYLQDLAALTGLHYHRLKDASSLSRAMQQDEFGIDVQQSTDIRWMLGLSALLMVSIALHTKSA